MRTSNRTVPLTSTKTVRLTDQQQTYVAEAAKAIRSETGLAFGEADVVRAALNYMITRKLPFSDLLPIKQS